MIVHCSWCDSVIKEVEPFEDTNITHGICPKCAVKMLDQVKSVLHTRGQGKKIRIFSEGDEIPYVIDGFCNDSKTLWIAVEQSRWLKFYEPPDPVAGRIMPERKFLVINMAIKHHGKGFLSIPWSSPPVFTLIDERGTEHAVSGNPVFAGRNLTGKVLSGSSLHPDIPLKGELVFDVPEGNYFLVVSMGVLGVNGCLRRAGDLCTFRLVPYEKRPDSNG